MPLPVAPAKYDQADQARLRGAIEQTEHAEALGALAALAATIEINLNDPRIAGALLALNLLSPAAVNIHRIGDATVLCRVQRDGNKLIFVPQRSSAQRQVLARMGVSGGPKAVGGNFAADWQRCAPMIEAALKHHGGGHTLDDVLDGVRAGDFQFWAGEWSAVVTEIIYQPHLKILNFWLLAGDLDELLCMRPQIERWGQAQGCRRAMGGGVHKAWGRVLAGAGYLPRWTIYAKELGG